MSNEEDILENPISQADSLSALPLWFRWVFGLSTGAILLVCMILYFCHISSPTEVPSPQELELGTLFVFSATILILVATPWDNLGIRLNKIGPFEFERIINQQAIEHIDDLAELRQLIYELEAKVRGMDEISIVSETVASSELRPLIKSFLRKHYPTAYSPLRIQKWGSKQEGYESFATYSLSNLRKILQDMVAADILETRISKMGNTLYKIAD